jgi:hypothetical protein
VNAPTALSHDEHDVTMVTMHPTGFVIVPIVKKS